MTTSPDVIMALCLKTLVVYIQDTIIATHLDTTSYTLSLIRLYRNIRLCRMHAYRLAENMFYTLNSNLSMTEAIELVQGLYLIELAVTNGLCGEYALKTACRLRDKVVEKAIDMQPKYNLSVLPHLEIVLAQDMISKLVCKTQ